MNSLKVTIPIGLGDLIYAKAMFDSVKSRYQEIHLRLHRDIVSFYQLDPNYNKFLDEISDLFFNEPPYILSSDNMPFYSLERICSDNKISPVKPELKNLLCKGKPLDLDEPYIVIVTKVRYMAREHFESKKYELLNILNQLSLKYRIVILGEKEVELNRGYIKYKDGIYSIYKDIAPNIVSNRLLDLTLPALGITAPDLKNIQQDCLIMSQAKIVITMGIGGGFCMATAVANTVGYRIDQDSIADAIFNIEHYNTVVTKNWLHFTNKLRELCE